MNMNWIKKHQVFTQKLTGLTQKTGGLCGLSLMIYCEDTRICAFRSFNYIFCT